MGAEAAGANPHLLRCAVDKHCGFLDIGPPSGSCAPLGVADVVTGLACFMAHFAYCHGFTFTIRICQSKIKPSVVFAAGTGASGGALGLTCELVNKDSTFGAKRQ